MKKILFFTDKISYSGASKIITWLVNSNRLNNYSITLATHIDYKDQRKLKNNVKRVIIKSNHKNKILNRIDTFNKLKKEIKKEKYDLCIGFLPLECLYLILVKFIYRCKVIVCERSDPYLEKTIVSLISRFFFRFADGAVFQTKGAMNYYPKSLRNKSVIIPNPVIKKEIKKYDNTNNKEISTSGRLYIKQKRQDVLLKAFKLVLQDEKSAILKIYGDGPDYQNLNNLAKKLQIEKNVFFEGKIDDIENKLSKSKLFVLSSDFEGIPNSIIEAMQCGLPIISTDCSPGGARILVENEYNGYLVPRGDSVELSKKILMILKDKKLSIEFGKNSLKKIDEFKEDKIIQLWINYINKFIDE